MKCCCPSVQVKEGSIHPVCLFLIFVSSALAHEVLLSICTSEGRFNSPKMFVCFFLIFVSSALILTDNNGSREQLMDLLHGTSGYMWQLCSMGLISSGIVMVLIWG